MTEQKFNAIKSALGALMKELEDVTTVEQSIVFEQFDKEEVQKSECPLSVTVSELSTSLNFYMREHRLVEEFKEYLSKYDAIKKIDALKVGCKQIGLSLRKASNIYNAVYEQGDV